MMNWINKRRNKKGFTLVELVVVIAILGILGGIAAPKFSAIRDESKVKADAATAAQIVNAARIQETNTGEKVTMTVGDDGKITGTLDDSYINPGVPQSGGSFLLAGGSEDPYNVTWTADKAGKANKVYIVTEGKAFDLTATK